MMSLLAFIVVLSSLIFGREGEIRVPPVGPPGNSILGPYFGPFFSFISTLSFTQGTALFFLDSCTYHPSYDYLAGPTTLKLQSGELI